VSRALGSWGAVPHFVVLSGIKYAYILCFRARGVVVSGVFQWGQVVVMESAITSGKPP
jgi:hypothetical protein